MASRSAIGFATRGASFSAATSTATVSGGDASSPSPTVSENAIEYDVRRFGAVNAGIAAAASARTAAGPSVWTQAYVSPVPSGSLLALPSSVTRSPSAAVRSGPASAVGASFAGATVTATRAVDSPPAPSPAV